MTAPEAVPEQPKSRDAATNVAEETEAASIEESTASAPTWPDEAAESAMVSELRDRGEFTPVASSRAAEINEEAETTALPPLNQLVEKIPTEVRETLEDLFRARFVTVKRVPKKALK